MAEWKLNMILDAMEENRTGWEYRYHANNTNDEDRLYYQRKNWSNIDQYN